MGSNITARIAAVARRRLILLTAGICAVPILLFLGVLGVRLLEGQGPPPIIEILHVREQVHSLQAVLDDPESYAAIRSRLAYCALWHIGSVTDGGAFRHGFYFAGRRRHTSRLQGMSFTTIRSDGAYRVSGRGEEYSYQHLGGVPAVARPEGLEALRAALDEEAIRSALIGVAEAQGLLYDTVQVRETESLTAYSILFQGRNPESNELVFLSWDALKGSEGWTFRIE